MNRVRWPLVFVVALASVILALGISPGEEPETSEEFMARICAGIYQTSDEVVLSDGEGIGN